MSKEEIIKAIKENHLNDSEFLLEIIKEGTDYWEPMVDVYEELRNYLLVNDEIVT
jgi:hypothetical protein|tara:strand:+ start:966 stop:1130 length:165 start_codon:yes stop_codon:yes gene_type:complete